jgi:hypothetical protein
VTVYTVPGTITDDGTADVTADLLAWIAGVPDGSSGSPNVLEFTPPPPDEPPPPPPPLPRATFAGLARRM